MVRDDPPELLDGLPELVGRLVGLPRVRVGPRQADVRLPDPVLRVVRQLVLGVPAKELAEARDGERVVALAEVDVRGLVEILCLR
jgi:hypothetical protein